jgi:hypothetical protein
LLPGPVVGNLLRVEIARAISRAGDSNEVIPTYQRDQLRTHVWREANECPVGEDEAVDIAFGIGDEPAYLPAYASD